MNGQKVTFTPSDVSAKVDAIKTQLATGYMPPAVVGHPKHDSPRVASVTDVKLDGGAAYLKVDELTPEFAESCRKGEYKYNSPAFYANGALRHLGILGGWNPSMKDQPAMDFGEGMFAEADAAAGGNADDLLVFGSPADWGTVVGGWLNRLAWRLKDLGTLLRGQREAMIADKGIEAADKALPAELIENLGNIDIPYNLNPGSDDNSSISSFGEPGAEPNTPAASASTGAEARLQAQLDAANKRLMALQGEAASRAFGEQLDKAVSAGRMSPVLRTAFQKLYASLTSADGLAFGEGDPIPASLEEVIGALPKVVEFGELGEGRTPDAFGEANPLIAECERRAAAAKEN